MQIKVPKRIWAVYDAIWEWGYTPLFMVGKYHVRRIDPFIAVSAIICTVYSGWNGGWIGALQGALFFAFASMVIIWLL